MIIRKREIISNGEAVDTFVIEDEILEKKIKNFLLKNEI
jgi:carbamoyl-phosphate synthase large subunit